jgi:intraflagellar transport protein 52
MSEGGEQKLGTNINAMLEQLGISVNNDSVIRRTFHKYLHPKEAFVANGILNDELVR